MKDFRNLKVWEKAHALTLEIYRLTASLPREEQFGLTLQMRRSASSIPTNIALGCGTLNDQDFDRHVQTALRVSSELEYQLILCRDLLYATAAIIDPLDAGLVEVKKMLMTFHQRLRN